MAVKCSSHWSWPKIQDSWLSEKGHPKHCENSGVQRHVHMSRGFPSPLVLRQLFSGWYDMYYYWWRKSSTSRNMNICNSNTNSRSPYSSGQPKITRIHSISHQQYQMCSFCHPAQRPQCKQRHDLQSWRSKPHISPAPSPPQQTRPVLFFLMVSLS